MKWYFPRRVIAYFLNRIGWLAVALLGSYPVWVGADQVQMQNGDQYSGKVVSMSAETLVLQSEVLGTLRLPRAKIVQVSIGTNVSATAFAVASVTNAAARPPALGQTNATPETSALLRQLGSNTNLINQVRAQFLSGAGSEADAKFNELLGGLSSGRLTVNDLAAQAKAAADQLRAARKDLGEEGGWMVDSYLAILDHFVGEALTASAVSTNHSKTVTRPKARVEEE